MRCSAPRPWWVGHDVAVAVVPPHRLLEAIEVAAARVGLVADHQGRPLAVAHRARAAVGQEVDVDVVGAQQEGVVAGPGERPLACGGSMTRSGSTILIFQGSAQDRRPNCCPMVRGARSVIGVPPVPKVLRCQPVARRIVRRRRELPADRVRIGRRSPSRLQQGGRPPDGRQPARLRRVPPALPRRGSHRASSQPATPRWQDRNPEDRPDRTGQPGPDEDRRQDEHRIEPDRPADHPRLDHVLEQKRPADLQDEHGQQDLWPEDHGDRDSWHPRDQLPEERDHLEDPGDESDQGCERQTDRAGDGEGDDPLHDPDDKLPPDEPPERPRRSPTELAVARPAGTAPVARAGRLCLEPAALLGDQGDRDEGDRDGRGEQGGARGGELCPPAWRPGLGSPGRCR